MKSSQKLYIKRELIRNFRNNFGLDISSRYKSTELFHEKFILEFDSYLDGIKELGSNHEFDVQHRIVLNEMAFDLELLINEIYDYGT